MKQCDKNIYLLLVVLALIVIGIITVKFASSYFSNLYETMDNFDLNQDQDNGKKMILFHWNDCGYCKKMMPVWDNLQNDYPNSFSKVEKAEITPAHENEFNITGYPVIFMTKNNKKYKEYNGERTYDAFKNFLDSEY